FDLKPDHANGGPFRPIATSVPGIAVSEHLPGVAKWMHRLAVVRSMSTKEGDHARARDHLRTGYLPQASIQFPVFGSLVSQQWSDRDADLPNYVSILPRGLFRAGSPAAGFLGPQHAPLLVGGTADAEAGKLQVENLSLPDGISLDQQQRRRELLERMEADFL